MVKVFKHHKTQFDESCVYYLVGVVKHYFQASSNPHPDIVFHFLCKADCSYNLIHINIFTVLQDLNFSDVWQGFTFQNYFLQNFAVVALSYH